MTHVERSAILPYSAAQMYQLVNDINAYPEFVPWCVKCEVHKESSAEKEATMSFAKHKINTSVTTRNALQQGEKIVMRLVEGPFKELLGTWKFVEIDANSCKVELNMRFAFSSRLYAMILGPIFNQVANKLITAFTERARQIYG